MSFGRGLLKRPYNFAGPIQLESACWPLNLEKRCLGWKQLLGYSAHSIPGTIPRDATPCGVAIDRSGTQLVRLPERFFSSLKFERPIAEALIIPFDVQGKPAGTVWFVAHDDSCKFDREDERIGRTLASFAALACHIRNAPATAQSQREVVEAGHIRTELQHLSDGLETRALEQTAELMAAGGHGDMPESVSTDTLSSLRNVVLSKCRTMILVTS